MLCGLRLQLEAVRPLLDEIISSELGPNALGERALTGLALQHLHPISLRCDVNSNEFWIGWPSHLYWIGPDRDWLLAHCFHLHPMAVRGVPKTIDIESTIDGDYLLALGIASSEYYVCKNSDELLCLELSSELKRINTRTGSLKSRHLSRFLAIGSNPLHHAFFANPIVFRTDRDPTPSRDTKQQIEHFIHAVQRGPGIIYRFQGSSVRNNQGHTGPSPARPRRSARRTLGKATSAGAAVDASGIISGFAGPGRAVLTETGGLLY